MEMKFQIGDIVESSCGDLGEIISVDSDERNELPYGVKILKSNTRRIGMIVYRNKKLIKKHSDENVDR